MNIDFNFGVKIISGEGCAKKNAALFAELGHSALVVTGRTSAEKSGALADISQVLHQQGVVFSVFNGVGANPTIAMCEQIVEAAREQCAEFFVAIGGGSVLDAAKAAAVAYLNNFDDAEQIYTADNCGTLPVICVGTTAGTGSEADGSAVITDRAGRKHSMPSAKRHFPVYSFCDPRYTMSMDLRQTVSTGLDALCHGVESYFKTNSTEVSRMFAEQSVKLVWPQLNKISKGSFDPQDYEMREALLYGSVIAGLSIEMCGTAYPHPAGYPLSESGGIPHGVACAVFECDFVKRCIACDPARESALAEMAAPSAEFCRVVSLLARNDLRVNSDMCERIAQRMFGSKNFACSPVEQDEKLAREIAGALCDPQQKELVSGGWLFGL